MDKSNNSVLIDAAKRFLAEQAKKKGQLKLVAKEAKLTQAWVYKFHEGVIQNPSCKNVEQLLRYAGYDVKVMKRENNNRDDN